MTGGVSVGRLLPVPQTSPATTTWTRHLLAGFDQAWRPREWDPSRQRFTPDPEHPNTRLRRCIRPGCGIAGQARFCPFCTREGKAAGWDEARLALEPRVPAARGVIVRAEDCTVTREGVRCAREQASKGLCHDHYHLWYRLKLRPALEEWAQAFARPYPHRGGCRLAQCEHDRFSDPTGLCSSHYGGWQGHRRKWRAQGRELTVETYLAQIAEPALAAGAIWLPGLPEPLRTELLWAMQNYDTTKGVPWDALGWRRVYTRLRGDGVNTLVGIDLKALVASSPSGTWHHLLRHAVSGIDAEHHRFAGTTMANPDLLDPTLIGLGYSDTRVGSSLAHRQSPLDLRALTQPWLRDGFRAWLLDTLPPLERGRAALASAVIASGTLNVSRGDRGLQPTLLALEDMTRVVTAIRGRWPVLNTQRNHLAGWFNVCDHARSNGLWQQIPDEFRRVAALHSPDAPESSADEPGQALPLDVIRLLNTHLPLIRVGADSTTYNGWTADLRSLRDQVMLGLLRDTGRRPSEIIALKDDAVGKDHLGEWVLTWDNIKAKRKGRKLPLQDDTARAVVAWTAAVAGADLSSPWLFPSPQRRAEHLSKASLDAALQRWIAVTPALTRKVLDIDGAPVAFDLRKITLYDFRHTYAQRHADAGVDPDELRELMDHRSITTTMVYYRVNWHRKRAAVKKVAPYATNNKGETVGMDEGRYGVSTVAVPFGGCSQPSNVKAGGTDCPIRFQCSGCEFYRPDPSYLPDLERHVAGLRSNLAAATAMGAKPYVLDGFQGQLNDYEHVITAMRNKLEELPQEERDEIEQASTVLRRARVAAARGLGLPLDVMHPGTAANNPSLHQNASTEQENTA